MASPRSAHRARWLVVGVGALLVVAVASGALPRPVVVPPTATVVMPAPVAGRGAPGLPPAVSFVSGTQATTFTARVVGPVVDLDQVPGLAELPRDVALLITFPSLGRAPLPHPRLRPDAVLIYVGADGRVAAIQGADQAVTALDAPYQAIVLVRRDAPYLSSVRVGDEVRAPGIAGP